MVFLDSVHERIHVENVSGGSALLGSSGVQRLSTFCITIIDSPMNILSFLVVNDNDSSLGLDGFSIQKIDLSKNFVSALLLGQYLFF